MKTITAEVEYVQGYLRYGYYELELTDEEFEKFKDMPHNEQKSYIRRKGHFVVSDYSIDDMGPITDINMD